MSQHDMNIANQGFPSFRADLNNALGALVSNSSGATAPTTTVAYQMWYDTTDNLLKMRNADNDAWITLAYFNQTDDEWEIRSAVIQAVDAAGVSIKTDDGTTRIEIQDDGDVAIDTDTLFVDATNNRVGVGTSAPNNTFHVSALSGDAIARIEAAENVGTADAQLRLQTESTIASGIIAFGDSADDFRGIINYDNGDDSMRISTAGSEAMRIDSSGDIFFGTTSTPDVKNESCMTFEPDVGRVHINANSTVVPLELNQSAPDTVTRTILRFHRNEAVVGSVTASTTGVNYNTSSDYRLKENVVDLTDAISRLKSLPVHRFNFIADPDLTVDGFLAHEAQQVVPEAVSGQKDGIKVWEEDEELPEGVSVGDPKLDADGNTIPDYQGIDQAKLVPLLTGALQEAIAKIEALEARIEALEA